MKEHWTEIAAAEYIRENGPGLEPLVEIQQYFEVCNPRFEPERDPGAEWRTIDHDETGWLLKAREQMDVLLEAVAKIARVDDPWTTPPEQVVRLAEFSLQAAGIGRDVWGRKLTTVRNLMMLRTSFRESIAVYSVGDWRGEMMLIGPDSEDVDFDLLGITPAPTGRGDWEKCGQTIFYVVGEAIVDIVALRFRQIEAESAHNENDRHAERDRNADPTSAGLPAVEPPDLPLRYLAPRHPGDLGFPEALAAFVERITDLYPANAYEEPVFEPGGVHLAYGESEWFDLKFTVDPVTVRFEMDFGGHLQSYSPRTAADAHYEESPLVRFDDGCVGRFLGAPVVFAEAPVADLYTSEPVRVLQAAVERAAYRLAGILGSSMEVAALDSRFWELSEYVEDDKGQIDWAVSLVADTPAYLPQGLRPDVAESMQAWLTAGLPNPHCPDEYLKDLRHVREWEWAAFPSAVGPMSARALRRELDPEEIRHFDPRLRRIEAGDWRRRFVMARSGRDGEFESLMYELVDGPLAIVVQRSHGGYYLDPRAVWLRAVRMPEDLRYLHLLAREIKHWPSGMLVVADDRSHEGSVRWQERPGGPLRLVELPPREEPRPPWQLPNAVEDAIRFLEQMWLEEQSPDFVGRIEIPLLEE